MIDNAVDLAALHLTMFCKVIMTTSPDATRPSPLPLVRDIVRRNLLMIEQAATVEVATKLLAERLVSALAVTDGKGEIVGVVSLRDLIGRASGDRIASVMTPLVYSIDVKVPVQTAARLMCDGKIHRLFVEEDGKIVGLVTLTDIARLVAEVGVGGASVQGSERSAAAVVQVDRPRDLFVASLARCGARLAKVFYERFMASSPAIRSRFTKTNMKVQEQKIAHTLHLAADAISGDPAALAELTRQAELHNRHNLDVPPELYELWLEAIIASVSECDPQWSPMVEHAWRLLMGNVIHRMTRAY